MYSDCSGRVPLYSTILKWEEFGNRVAQFPKDIAGDQRRLEPVVILRNDHMTIAHYAIFVYAISA